MVEWWNSDESRVQSGYSDRLMLVATCNLQLATMKSYNIKAIQPCMSVEGHLPEA